MMTGSKLFPHVHRRNLEHMLIVIQNFSWGGGGGGGGGGADDKCVTLFVKKEYGLVSAFRQP